MDYFGRFRTDFLFFSLIILLVIFGIDYSNSTAYGAETIDLDLKVVQGHEIIDNKVILTISLQGVLNKPIPHVNYDIRAIQNNALIFLDSGIHSHSGIETFELSKLCSNSDVDFTLELYGFGDEDPLVSTYYEEFTFSIKPTLNCELLTVETDSDSYIQGDTITISGIAEPVIENSVLIDVNQDKCRVVDAFENKLDNVSIDQQVQISCDLENKVKANQPFAYLVQIQKENHDLVSLTWITGSLSSEQSFSPSLSWIPDESGIYIATIFVWEDVKGSKSLSNPAKIPIKVGSAGPSPDKIPIPTNPNLPVSIKIEDQSGNIVLIDEIIPNYKNIYSKTISSQGSKWDKAGDYKVTAVRNSLSEKTTFSFIMGEIDCPEGSRLSGNSCIEIICTVGYKVDGHECKKIQCDTGFKLDGNSCKKIQCDTGFKLDGNSCKKIQCDTGFKLDGNSCKKIQCDTGFKLDGNSCKKIQCDTGFKLDGNSCKKIQCPAGTSISGNKCIDDFPYWIIVVIIICIVVVIVVTTVVFPKFRNPPTGEQNTRDPTDDDPKPPNKEPVDVKINVETGVDEN